MGLLSAVEERGFDQVRLGGEGTPGASVWTRRDFEKLPLIDRVRLLAGGEIRFFLAGKEVSSREALKTL